MSNIFTATGRTAVVNGFLKRSGTIMLELADENTRLHADTVKLSEALDKANEEVAMTKVAFEVARAGGLQYRQIPQFVQQKLSEGITPDQIRHAMRNNPRLHVAEAPRSAAAEETVKESDGRRGLSNSALEAMRKIQSS